MLELAAPEPPLIFKGPDSFRIPYAPASPSARARVEIQRRAKGVTRELMGATHRAKVKASAKQIQPPPVDHFTSAAAFARSTIASATEVQRPIAQQVRAAVLINVHLPYS